VAGVAVYVPGVAVTAPPTAASPVIAGLLSARKSVPTAREWPPPAATAVTTWPSSLSGAVVEPSTSEPQPVTLPSLVTARMWASLEAMATTVLRPSSGARARRPGSLGRRLGPMTCRVMKWVA